MSSLGETPTRDLALELVRRSPGIVKRRFGRSRLVSELQAGSSAPPAVAYAMFERDGADPVELIEGYRDTIKSRWRTHFWPTRLLFQLEQRTELPSACKAIADELRSAPTLPRSLPEILAEVGPFARSRDALVRELDRYDEKLETHPLVPEPLDSEMQSIASHYVAFAASLARRFAGYGIMLEESRLLETGCGTGYMSHALAAQGVREAIGIDMDLESWEAVLERPKVIGHIRDGSGAENTVRLQEADASELPFPDGHFDLVFGISAFEHFAHAAGALAEAHRVLRPGGICYHDVGPWFGPTGGHNLCTLDFPWGHARVSEPEFEQYVRQFRPHEADYDLEFYRGGFQDPRLSLRETERIALDAGFELVEIEEHRAEHRHLWPLLDRDLLGDVNRVFPDGSLDDLITDVFTLVLRRR